MNEGLIALFKLCEANPAKAFAIAERIPVEKLDYIILIKYQDSEDPDVRILSKVLANKIKAEMFDIKVLMEFQKDSMSVSNLAESLSYKIPREALDFNYLLGYKDDTSVKLSNLAIKLLLRNFAEELDYVALIEFQKSQDIEIRNLAFALAIEKPASDFDLKTLIDCRRSHNTNVISLSELLVEKIPVITLDLGVLIDYQKHSWSESTRLSEKLIEKIPGENLDINIIFKKLNEQYLDPDPYVRAMLYNLALKIPTKSLNVKDLLLGLESPFLNVKNLAARLLMNNFVSSLDSGIVLRFQGFKDRTVVDLATAILRARFSDTFEYDVEAGEFVKQYFN